jgi:hypothetical protein
MFKKGSRTRRGPLGAGQNLFHSVSIQPREGCACAKVQALQGVLYLSDDAPLLPIEGCEHPIDCRCTFVHFEDRRTESRRESDAGLPARASAVDQRVSEGRRVTD